MDNLKFVLKASVILFVLGLSSCNYIDDYTLGKDNTPAPSPLPKVTHQKEIKIDWSRDVGSFKKGILTPDLQPAIDNDKLFVATNDGSVTAAYAKTGQVLWQIKLKTPLLSGPVLSDTYVILCGDDSAIYILDKANGAIKYRILLSNDSIAKPLVQHNTLYVKTINGHLYRINLRTGHIDWTYERGSPEIILKASSSPVIYQNMVFAGFSDGALVGLERSNGHVLFQQHIAFPIGASEIESLVDIDTNPIIDGDDLYIATYQGEVGVYSIRNSQFKWHRRASTYHDLAIDGQYMIMVDSHDVIWAFEKNTGQVLWKQKGLKARGLSAPVFWHHQIWVADRLGVMHGIDPNTGEFKGQIQLPSAATSAPVVKHDSCWVTTSNGQLHRLLLRN
ncbi:MAG: outer membrane protein assembly factor BamB [Gammaproteobacteria bacterium]|nr:outer membrane protein assembly factor BamB [Gammaproteobacteria bacterium]